MTDRYSPYADVTTPATRSTPIVPSGNVIDPAPKALLVGGAGDVVGQLLEDTADRTFVLQPGYHPLRFKKITSATATGLIALD